MEIEALAGMKEIIKRSPKLIILTEWQWGVNAYKDPKLGAELINWLLRIGYTFYEIFPNNACRTPNFVKKPTI